MQDENCIFCKIVNEKIPSSRVYEDSSFIVILDIMPANKGHVLIIPKQHFETLDEMPSGLAQEMMAVEQKAIMSMLKSLKPDGYNCLQNNKPEAGQVVPHVHVHIVPRWKDDGLKLHWPGKKYEGSEMKEYAEKLKKAFQ